MGACRHSAGRAGAERRFYGAEYPVRSMAGTRTRLDIDLRRSQLVEIGMELFAKRAYDEVSVEEIAAAAGVSRGLLYHYFPTKRDFFVEVVRGQVEHIAGLTAPDTSKPPLESLRESLDTYVRYVEDTAQAFLSIHRAGIG